MLVERDLPHCKISELVDPARITSGANQSAVVFGVARDVAERKKAQEQINYQAYHDLLTGCRTESF
ncbi:MAG: hypothetical protein R3F37_01760 [Candidatus Competibacteraceae bacterium]